jgi:hypothetical protein
MCESMSDDRPSEVLGALPHTRPHRRSQKRGTRPPAEPANGPATENDAPAKAQSDAPAAAQAEPREAESKSREPVKPAPRRRKAAAPSRTTSRPKTGGSARTRAKPERLPQPAQPAGAPPTPRSRKPVPATGADILGTAVHAVAELAEIGLSVSARALRSALSRLPRP